MTSWLIFTLVLGADRGVTLIDDRREDIAATVEMTPGAVRELIPTFFSGTVTDEAGAAVSCGDVLLLVVKAQLIHMAHPERIFLKPNAAGKCRGEHTFRGSGRYQIKLAHERRGRPPVIFKATITVAPQEWLTFQKEFGWFVLGVVVLAIFLFGAAARIRKRARSKGTTPQ